MEYLQEYKWPYIISQVAILLILWADFKSPRLARLMFVLIFGGACYVNFRTAAHSPEVYLDYATMSLPFYADFINGWFKDHISLAVSLIALGQGVIAIAMLLNKGWLKFACIASIVFLVAIAPLGIGAAFPFSLTMSVAAILIMKNSKEYLWEYNKFKLNNMFNF